MICLVFFKFRHSGRETLFGLNFTVGKTLLH